MIPRQSPSGPFLPLLTAPKLYDNGNSGAGPVAIDWSRGPVQLVTLTGAPALSLFGGLTAGQSAELTLELQQDGTGTRIPTWPGVAIPTGFALSTSAGARDLVKLTYDGVGMYASVPSHYV